MPTRRPIDLSNPLPGIMPWGGRTSNHSGGKYKARESLHYKGWTLVDTHGWRCAAKGDERMLVCRDGIEHPIAIQKFREKVDARESEL